MGTFTGTPDDDGIVGTPVDDSISALAGNDVVNALEGNDVIDGGDGHDLLNGQQGDDFIQGGNGDDLIRPGTGNDVADGGGGFNRVSYASVGTDELATGVTVSLAAQGTYQDTGGGGVDFLVNFQHLTGTRFSDTLTGDNNDNWIWGGIDPITGTAGNDIISGGGGNDLIQVGIGNSTADGGTGTDTLTFFGSDVGLAAGISFSLALQGTTQATSFGNITATNFENLSGSNFADTLTGDGGNNVLAGDQGNDTLLGGGGSDTLYGDGQIIVDTHGLGYSGQIVTVADAVTLDPTAVDGNDTLDGGAGDDVMNGGGGTDTASFASWTQRVIAGLGNTGNGFATNDDGTENDQLISIENLSGSAFNDSLNGNDGNNVLTGGDGHDLLFGRGGNDTMIGGNGDDFLRGSDGADILDGGSGFDRVSSFVTAPTGGIHFDLNIQGVAQDTGQGMDTLIGIEHASGTVLDDTLTGNGGDNWLWDGSDGVAGGGTGNDVMSGGGGNDVLETGGGNDVLDGGSGVDTWSFLGGQVEISSAGVTASLALQGAAQNTEQGMMSATGFENLSGSLYDDNLTGDGGDNVIAGDLGGDTLLGGDGNDTLYGDGRIQVDYHGTGGSGPITTFAQADDVDLDGDGTPDFVSGNDTLDGGAGDDIMNGGLGVDTASFASWTVGVTVGLGPTGNGFATNDEGTENDTLISIENITGSAFSDFINGNDLDNVLTGGDGGDALFGRGGADTLLGGNGDDFLRGSDGADTLNGGAGWDRVSSFVATPTGGIHFDLNIQGVAQDTGQGMDTLIGIEHASGTTLDDTLTGNGGDNWLWDGSDGVAGGSTGNDTMSGGGGNDLLETGGGNDLLSGGAGTDTISFLGGHVETSANVTYSLALQGAAQATGVGSMNTSGFENASGSLLNDTLTGDGNANVLAGDFGNDTLNGGSGNDTLYGDGRIWVDTSGSVGGSGPITTFGTADDGAGLAAGNDVLNGGNGNDKLYGGRGNDTLTGGAGDDQFIFQAGVGNDRITDLNNHDTIVFEASSGVTSFGQLTLTKVGNNTIITWGTSDSIQVDGVKPNQLHASDFSFVTTAAAPAAAAAALSAPHDFIVDHEFGALNQAGHVMDTFLV